MLYRFISEFAYTDLLRQFLLIRPYYYTSREKPESLIIALPKLTNILLLWTDTEVDIAMGFGYNLLDIYYELTGNWNYLDEGILYSARQLLLLQNWLHNGVPIEVEVR